MIKVETITIKEFRGIRNLTLNLNGENFAISGPNGTGKSGVVDALDFGLAGSISRLSGKGRGALSVKAHGPHVDSREHPEKAVVVLDLVIPSLGNKKARITRSVKNPTAPTIVPDDPDVRAALDQIAAHPEFVLSRREIVEYVLAEPGERSKEIQALLQLDDIETVRATLVKIANATEKELKPIELARNSAREALLRALDIPEATPDAVLGATNTRRAVLGLPPLLGLEPTTSIRDGVESLAAATPNLIVKAAAKADFSSARDRLADLKSEDFSKRTTEAVSALQKLQANEASLTGMARDDLLKSALDLFDGAECPVCETPWEPEAFKQVVNAQREKLAAIVNERKAVEALLEPIAAKMTEAASALRMVAAICPKFSKPMDAAPLNAYCAALTSATATIRKFLPIEQTIAALASPDSAQIDAMLVAVGAALDEIPEPTERDAARDFLFIGQERLQGYRVEAARFAAANRRANVANKVRDTYGTSTTAALNAIYQKVEQEFRDYYRAINSDDEGAFEAHLTPSIGKLGFDVNFYGRGFFPPGAYHSEGHQDSMGLCLYLALMKHLLGPGFTFAVLDDVLMSVDTGHRREVCTLLKTAFPNTQFVLTTHDGVWLRHMKSAGLIKAKAAVEFRKWDVDHGPAEWKSSDVWAEIEGDIAKNEIRRAAGLLRYHLEYLAAEYCARLGGYVSYKGDGRYELGDLMPAAVGAMAKLLKEAKASANSWNNAAVMQSATAREGQFAAAVAASKIEEWQINPAVHFNAWENLSAADFAPVAAAFKKLMAEFVCPKCGGPLYLVKSGHTNNMLRCDCSDTSFSLTKKP